MLDTLASRNTDPRQRRLLFRDVPHPRDGLAAITPNWFASVMGTGIVANAAVTLPLQLPGMRATATVVWLLACLLLGCLIAATIAHWRRYPRIARGHLDNPVMAHFYGAPAMALLTVGAGALQLGGSVIGPTAALALDAALWIAGTLFGLATAVIVPYRQFTRHQLNDDSAFAGWLMPVVPPMVSAATGTLLLDHVPAGQWRSALLWSCYAMVGISLLAALLIFPLLWSRLARHGAGAAAMVPTWWIALGPLGQSVTAVNLLGAQAHLATDAHLASGLRVLGVALGVPVLGFALLWAAIASALTIRTARRGLPFSLTWWSFTFPVGTCVTGASALAARTGSVCFAALAVAGYVCLVGAWLVVAGRTFAGAIVRGTLLTPALPPSDNSPTSGIS